MKKQEILFCIHYYSKRKSTGFCINTLRKYCRKAVPSQAYFSGMLESFHLPHWLDIIARAAIIYIFIIAGMRIFGKKEIAQLSVVDFVFILLISNSVQNAMIGPDTSLEGGILAAGALFLTNFIIKKLVFRSKKLKRFIEGKEIMLIYKGVIKQENLHKAEITVEELMAVVRGHGFSSVNEVSLAMLEVSGEISVLGGNFSKENKTE